MLNHKQIGSELFITNLKRMGANYKRICIRFYSFLLA